MTHLIIMFKRISNISRKLVVRVAALCLLLGLVACVSLGPSTGALYAGEHWQLMPLQNNSASANAPLIAQSMLESNLRIRGVSTQAPTTAPASSEHNKTGYVLSGSIDQWGREQLNGRDARVELSLTVHSMPDGNLVWSGREAVAGKGGSSVSKVANKAVMRLVNSMNLVVGVSPATQEDQRSLAVKATTEAIQAGTHDNSVATSTGFRTVSLDKNGFSPVVNRDFVGKSLAIFYGANPPVEELAQFDRLVLEPDNIDPIQLSALTSQGAQAYAYLSVGEVGPTRSYARNLQQEWILGNNTVWDSTVLDISNRGWTDFLMQRIDQLVQAGYTGLFLDTMDSYHIVAKTDQARQLQATALGQFIRSIKQRHQGIKLISNRGFEVLNQTGPHLEAIAAESLFASWDNAAQEYIDVPENDREWLLGKLNAAKKQFGLDVIAIEYLPPERREEARKLATEIAELGFTPWVSTPELDYVGVGTMEVMPRKVMLLFDSRVHGRQADTEVHELIAPLLEYYGYVPVYFDVATQALPEGELKGQIAGLVTWSSSQYAVPELQTWFKRQLKSDIPVAMFGAPIVPLDAWLSEKLGLSANASIDVDSLETSYESNWINYEKALPARIESVGVNVRSTHPSNQVHLAVKDNLGVNADLVVVGKWGGLAAHPAASNADIDDTYYWVTNPFKFLTSALRLQKLPMPDVTTENGNRLWTSHIDGDALPSWAEVPGRKLGAEMIHENILQRYNMPHSISIVEAEMTSIDAYADRRTRMFDVAKRIFAMPSVELATHTYSHPYKWESVGKYPGSGKYNLDVGPYQFSPEREIAGSARFIDENLAPSNKKTKLMLWSGNALPEESALAAAYNSGMINLNGGFTTITTASPSVSRISPMARTVGQYVQAYAPIMNENVYTNDWRGPFDGFRRVIETFEMTDKPRRFKPLSIYYHFYAGTKKASLRSLEEIYDWSIKQDIMPVYASYYAKKVPHFRQAGLARYLDGSWKLSGLGEIKSIRILDQDVWPDLAQSRGLVGARKLHDGTYMHTNGASEVVFKTTQSKPTAIHLVSANGQVESWNPSEQSVAFRVLGHVPVKLELSRSAQACSIRANGKSVQGATTKRNTVLFTFTSRDTGNAVLNCQA